MLACAAAPRRQGGTRVDRTARVRATLQRLSWRPLREPEIAEDVEALREDTLRSLLGLATWGYVVWHTASIFLTPPAGWWRYWSLALVVGLGVAATRLARDSRLARATFLASAVVAVLAAAFLFDAAAATVFLPLVAVAAVVLLHPLAGLVVAAVSTVGLGLLGVGDGAVAAASFVAVLLAWALGRNMVVAVEW